MKATKLVGAIVGVLMVAALFTGAVAADSTAETPLGDVYFYALYDNNAFDGLTLAGTTWTSTGLGVTKTITFIQENGRYYVAGDDNDAGTYTYNTNGKTFIIDAKMPTVAVSGIVYENNTVTGNGISYLIGNTANTKNAITISVPQVLSAGTNTSNATLLAVEGLMFTNPDGTLTASAIPGVTISGPVSSNGNYVYTILNSSVSAMDQGTWTVQAYFAKGGNFSNLASSTMLGQKYTFTIVDSQNTKKLIAAEENVTQGALVTLEAIAPYGYYYIDVSQGGYIPDGQDGLSAYSPSNSDNATSAKLKVGVTGKKSFVVKSTTTDDLKVKLYEADHSTLIKEVSIKVTAGAIVATVDKDSVYLGDKFTVSGTSDVGGSLYFFIKGTNYALTPYTYKSPESASGKTWTIDLESSNFADKNGKLPDAGTYSIYVAKLASSVKPENITSTDYFDDSDYVDAYTVVTVSLLQPFITVNVPEAVVQGEKLEISGTAEGNPKNVLVYVFGTNFFANTTASVLDDGTYSLSQKIVAADKVDGSAWSMASGQYFLVVQHPMYDTVYNIAPIKNADGKTYDIKINETTGFGNDGRSNGANGTILFNTNVRQSANAAYALIEAISDENIDDMQAHKSFIVKTPESYVNAIPSQVTKGQKLTISGTTVGHKNEMVSVEILSTAFSALSKTSAGSSASAVMTTRIGDDGVWSVTFDTSSLNADDYSVSITVGQLDPVTGKTKIVDSGSSTTPTTSPTTQPTVAPTSVQPTAQPTTTPATPGFGALAALVGLGAVAVLLLRRE